MPEHTQSSDPHEHGRPARPKSGSSRKGTTTTNVLNKLKTNTNPAGSGSPVKKGDKRDSLRPEQKRSQAKKGVIYEQNENNKIEDCEMKDQMDRKEVNGKKDAHHEENIEEELKTVGNTRTRFTRPDTPPKAETPPPALPSPKQPDGFILENFHNTVDTFTDIFSSQKFTNVTDDYPVDELVRVVNDVTNKIEAYKQQTLSSQRHLEELRMRMRDVKERIQNNIQQNNNAIRMSK